MNVFAIGDLHLSIKSDKPMDVFGVHWENHMEKLKANWHQVVSKEDLVLIPGDISWAMRLKEAQMDLEWLNQLPGRKICIRGNHDYWWDRPSPLNRMYKHIYFLQNVAYLLDNLAICGTRGWALSGIESEDKADEKMISRECIRLKLSLDDAMKRGAKEIWVMLHYPPNEEGHMDSPFIELIKQYPVTRVIYGHLHDEESWKKAPIGSCDGIEYHLVAADYLEFKPLPLAKVELKINE
ncbi:MAG: serine/threonine protein phosphatase [Cellulosilyticum sp.]|nr:serine/threonine protein phosphatase [Cellulosilyticum sp.]